MADRESYLYQAKLAEQAERYEGCYTLIASYLIMIVLLVSHAKSS